MMKSVKTFLISILAATAAFSAAAQDFVNDPRFANFGATPEERQANAIQYQFLRDAYTNKEFDAALDHLRILLAGAPKSNENIYVWGSAIYRSKIVGSRALPEKRAFVDTLMQLYDLRLENFGQTPERAAVILGNKAKDFLSYNPMQREQIRTLFQQAIEGAGAAADPDVVNIYFNELATDFKSSEIAADLLLGEFERLGSIFDAPEAAEAKKTFETIFAQSGAASGENLEAIYRPQVEAAPTDVALLQRAFNMLRRAGADSPFMMEVGEKLYAAEPNADVAVLLAMMFEERKEYSKALKYVNETLETETDPIQRSSLLVRAAASQLGGNNARTAADLARQAIDNNPENGYAYLILGNAYAAGASACSGFDRQAAYWIVYDTLARARGLLANGDAEAQAMAGSLDSQLGGFRAGFPSKEDCFFRGLNNGDGYTVSCGWVSGRTTVRER